MPNADYTVNVEQQKLIIGEILGDVTDEISLALEASINFETAHRVIEDFSENNHQRYCVPPEFFQGVMACLKQYVRNAPIFNITPENLAKSMKENHNSIKRQIVDRYQAAALDDPEGKE